MKTNTNVVNEINQQHKCTYQSCCLEDCAHVVFLIDDNFFKVVATITKLHIKDITHQEHDTHLPLHVGDCMCAIVSTLVRNVSM